MIEVRFEADKNRAAIYDGNQEIGECTFSQANDTWIIDHTFVSPAYNGQGLARKLVNAVIDAARTQSLKVGATCSYAVKLLKEEQYQDVAI